MTTDRAGPEGTIGIAIDKGRESGDHSAAVLYWFGPGGRIYILDAGPHLIEWSQPMDPTSWDRDPSAGSTE